MSCRKHLLVLDIYKRPLRLILPDQNDYYRTLSGTILSLLTFVLLTSYGIFKMDKLINLREFQVLQAFRVHYYKDLDTFGIDSGFAFAAGLVEWDDG